jgi:hypothetical protein
MIEQEAVISKINDLRSKGISDIDILNSLTMLNPNNEFYTVMLHLLQDLEDTVI